MSGDIYLMYLYIWFWRCLSLTVRLTETTFSKVRFGEFYEVGLLPNIRLTPRS
jgi:hypothetical protein